MNADTKKKIEEHAKEFYIADDFLSKSYRTVCINNYEEGAEFGYSLALKDAEVLVKALNDIYQCTDEDMRTGIEGEIALKALEQWKKVTE